MRAYEVLDVFTDTPLQGNPVAVFTDGTGLSDELMQRVARELNLSETVFVLDGDDDADARVRIFTPAIEMPFAGHPVLGTAFALGGRRGLERVRLRTGVGVITIDLRREGERVVYGEMEQPVPTWEELREAGRLLEALGVERAELPIEVYDNGPRHAFVALASESVVAGLRPDMGAVGDVGQFGVSCFAFSGRRVTTRMFGPALGVAEDPATGSAAGPLAVHLARHGWTRFGEWIEIHQGLAIGRPSILHAIAEGAGDRLQRVRVGGGAVVVAHGEYSVD